MKKTTEAGFQQTVILMAQSLGWKVAHFRKARTKKGWATPVAANGKGFFDLFCVHPGRGWVFVAELKIPGNKQTPEQEAWERWTMNAIPTFLWYPVHWGWIELVLRNGPHGPESS